MVRLLSISIGVVSTMVVLLPIMFVVHYTVFRRHDLKKTIFIFIYAAYLSAVFTAVGIPTINTLAVSAEFNWIPVIDIINSPTEYIKNTVLNIILFVPLGFLLPAIWSKYRPFKITFFTGLGLSFIIEILQIFSFRLTDVDDLLTNTAGTIIGYCLSRMFSEKLRLKLPDSNGKYEPIALCVVVFLIMFVIQPLISSEIWEYVLSSSLWERIR
ncbi:MAG: VanZ family protein [Acetatifactor sp.]|nr:VanZ family protein [Acetatifactor sp.]